MKPTEAGKPRHPIYAPDPAEPPPKKNKRRFLRVALILAAVFLTTASAITYHFFLSDRSLNISEAPPLVNTKAMQIKYSNSELNISLDINHKRLAADINNALQQPVTLKGRLNVAKSRLGIFDMNYNFVMTRVGEVSTRAEGEDLIFRMPISFRFELLPIGDLFFRHTQRVHGRVIITVKARLGLHKDWQPYLVLDLAYDWQQAAYTYILGAKIILSDLIEKNFTGILQKMINKTMANAIDLPKEMKKGWQALQDPVQVNEEPPVWLIIQPKKIYFPPLSGDEQVLKVRFAIQLRIATLLTQNADDLIASALARERELAIARELARERELAIARERASNSSSDDVTADARDLPTSGDGGDDGDDGGKLSDGDTASPSSPSSLSSPSSRKIAATAAMAKRRRTPLPALVNTLPSSDRSLIRLPIVLGYQTIVQQLKKQVAGKTFPIEQDNVLLNSKLRILDFKIYPSSNNTLCLGVLIDNRSGYFLSTRGWIYFLFRPKINRQKNTILFADINFTRQLSNTFLETGTWILGDILLTIIKNQVTIDLNQPLQDALQAINKKIFNKKLADGVFLKSNLSDLGIEGMDVTQDAFLLYTRLAGKLAIVIEEKAEAKVD